MVGCWNMMKFLITILLLIFFCSVFFSSCHGQSTADKIRREINFPKTTEYSIVNVKSAELDFYTKAMQLMDMLILRLEKMDEEDRKRP